MTDPRSQIALAAKYFHQRGWMLGTAGNLSAKLDDDSLWITASGKSKGELSDRDFIRLHPNGDIECPVPGLKPSAETAIHQTIYRCIPDAKACYHVHSIDGNLVSNFTEEQSLLLPPLEMVKGLGVWVENPTVKMSLFDNHLDVPKIGQEIAKRFAIEMPEIPAILIRNHGVTVWGKSTEEARNRIEIVEYIFSYMVQAKQVGI
jgi:methylthioribulose-1-phosphate dehydratase